MKKLDSKLFKSIKLTDKEAQNCVGGLRSAYTTKASDTSSSSGNYDITFTTTNSDGSNPHVDAVFTGPTNTDAPV